MSNTKDIDFAAIATQAINQAKKLTLADIAELEANRKKVTVTVSMGNDKPAKVSKPKTVSIITVEPTLDWKSFMQAMSKAESPIHQKQNNKSENDLKKEAILNYLGIYDLAEPYGVQESKAFAKAKRDRIPVKVDINEPFKRGTSGEKIIITDKEGNVKEVSRGETYVKGMPNPVKVAEDAAKARVKYIQEQALIHQCKAEYLNDGGYSRAAALLEKERAKNAAATEKDIVLRQKAALKE